MLSGAQRTVRMLSRVLRTRYAGFVFGLPLARGEVPVFTYHDAEAGELARDLQFLQHNGYRTLSLDEFLGASSGGDVGGRRVLLTFDDARKSFWQVAMPLLREFGARALLFAPTYWMNDPALRRGSAADLFMSWDQLRQCLASGLVDVQSHAHRHALVFTSNRLVGFANPGALERYDIYDWPIRGVGAGEELGRPALGTPIYAAAPLLSARRRYLEDGELTQLCLEFVQSSGGEEFFARSDWSARLRAVHASRFATLPGCFSSDQALRDLVASEFEQSRDAFRNELGYTPTCLAYPWMLGSRHSMELAKYAGIRALFGVALDFRRARRGNLPIRAFGRFKCDWLRFLPGEGRSSMLATIGRKVSGFARLEHLAH